MSKTRQGSGSRIKVLPEARVAFSEGQTSLALHMLIHYKDEIVSVASFLETCPAKVSPMSAVPCHWRQTKHQDRRAMQHKRRRLRGLVKTPQTILLHPIPCRTRQCRRGIPTRGWSRNILIISRCQAALVWILKMVQSHNYGLDV